jgi:hypothetical protein
VADQQPNLFRQLISHLEPTAEETLARLSPDEARVFTELGNDQIDISGAVLDAYGRDDLLNSLVFYDFKGLPKQLLALGLDLLCGRYEDVRRGLRFAWESIFRAFYADCYPMLCPTDPDQPGPTLDHKAAWLEGREKKLNRDTVILPVLRHLLPAWSEAEVLGQFKPVWDRLNAAAHPSADWRVSGVQESVRHAWLNFDEAQARQLVSDAREVFAVVWVAALKRFPRAVAKLAADPDAFRACPQVRLLFPGEGARRIENVDLTQCRKRSLDRAPAACSAGRRGR